MPFSWAQQSYGPEGTSSVLPQYSAYLIYQERNGNPSVIWHVKIYEAGSTRIDRYGQIIPAAQSPASTNYTDAIAWADAWIDKQIGLHLQQEQAAKLEVRFAAIEGKLDEILTALKGQP